MKERDEAVRRRKKERDGDEREQKERYDQYIPSQWTVRLEEAAPQKEGIYMLTRHNLALTYVCTVPQVGRVQQFDIVLKIVILTF